MSSHPSRTITCRGAVCWGVGQGLKVEVLQVEPPRKDEVRVRMLRASICHTDILFLDGDIGDIFPRIVGHEGVGVIESVGEGVVGLSEGDTVIPVSMGECKQCPNCLSNKTNLCFLYPIRLDALMPDKSSRMFIDGRPIYHAFSCSTLCEFAVVNANYVVKLDAAGVPLPHASLLSCGFTTGFGASWKDTAIAEASTVAVLGLGAVGLGAISGAKVLGAAKIIGVDLNAERENPARKMGMTDFINPRNMENKSISEAIKEMTHGLGVDYCFECTGVVELIAEALAATVPGRGVAVVLGTSKQETATVGFGDLMTGRTLKGLLLGGIKSQSDLPTILRKCANKEFQLDPLITHEIGLSDIGNALEILKKPECLKLIIRLD